MNIHLARLRTVLLVLLLGALACTFTVAPPSVPPPPTEDVAAMVRQTLDALSTANATQPATEPPLPGLATETFTPGVLHTFFPAEIQSTGIIVYDVDSRGTASEHRAPYGDSYKLNRFERPFTQTVMNYLPDVDIQTFRATSDQNWFYIFIDIAGPSAAGGLTADYGVELDFDRDGHGDFLIWAQPPYASSWTTERVTVFSDSNNDTGGLSPERSDAPFNGNGYDLVLISSGRNGIDPDLAWVRLDPRSSTTIQFAFKKSLTGSSFLCGVWADLGLRDASRFSYNDYFTEEQAGSPETGESLYYPIKAIHSVDNTCREAIGFKPTGYEPLLCPRNEPTPPPRSTQIVPTVCQPPPYCVPPNYIWHQDTCWCEAIPW